MGTRCNSFVTMAAAISPDHCNVVNASPVKWNTFVLEIVCHICAAVFDTWLKAFLFEYFLVIVKNCRITVTLISWCTYKGTNSIRNAKGIKQYSCCACTVCTVNRTQTQRCFTHWDISLQLYCVNTSSVLFLCNYKQQVNITECPLCTGEEKMEYDRSNHCIETAQPNPYY